MPKAPNRSNAPADASAQEQATAGDAAVTEKASSDQVQDEVTTAPAELAQADAPIGYIVRCHRDRGVWRAGRFWPPEPKPVAAEDLTPEQLDALRTEPLLSVLPVQE